MMKYPRGMICLLGTVLVLSGCNIDEMGQQPASSGDSTPELAIQAANANQNGDRGPDQQVGEVFRELNQLAAGTLYLQSSERPITAEQAASLLPLWQSLQSFMQPGQPAQGSDSTPAAPAIDDTQITATLDSIKAALTPEQEEMINNLTQEQIAAVYQQQGIEIGGFGGPPRDGTPGPDEMTRWSIQGPGDGTPQAMPGGEQRRPPADFPPPADFTPGARGNRGFVFGSPLVDAVIQMLQELAGS